MVVVLEVVMEEKEESSDMTMIIVLEMLVRWS
jgi:hypothetical protein